MSASGRYIPIRFSGRIVAIGADDVVYLLPPLDVLEPDHPHRRFVSMLALVIYEMGLGFDDDPHDDALAAFYARAGLLPDGEFLRLDDGRSDAALAEHFNVPLEQVEQKRYDLAFVSPPRRPKGPQT